MIGAPPLRPYQTAVIERIKRETAAGRRRLLVTAPTGSGKTIILSEMIRDAVGRSQRALVLAHRREIIGQTVGKLFDAGIDAGIVQAGFPPRPSERVQVASVATLHARAIRSSTIDLPEADLVIVDECHHVRARTYRQILDRYPEAAIVGLTATPCRGDGRGLGAAFDVLIEAETVAGLTRDGFLVPARVYAPTRPDLAGIEVRRGDYVEAQLAERMDQQKLVGDIVEHWLRLGGRRRTVAFCTGVAHSVHVRDEFRRAGVLAEHLCGATPMEERDAILARLMAGNIDVVTNAMVLTEGWDCPAVSCLILARPTKSLGLFRQMAGRVLRPSPGKTEALILDHAGAVYQHGLVDDPIEWTLREDKRAENKAQSARGRYQAPALVDCPECGAVRFQGSACPACGWRPKTKAQPVEVIDGELGEVNRQRRVTPISYSANDRHRFHAELAHIAHERGYKEGWVAHKFKERFGTWPDRRHVEPMVPDAATRAWVKSRQIAFAKSAARR